MPIASLPIPLLVGLAFTFSAQTLEAADPAWASTPPKVVGSDRFVQQVQAALKLIQAKSPPTHWLIQRNVAIIRQAKRSGMWAYKTPPVYEMADPTTFYSVTWCAGSIAHDALHSKLYHDYRTARKGPVPDNVWTGHKAEVKCISFQLEVLRKLGASQHELDHCVKQNGKHYDLDNDGQYKWNDYFKRDW